MAYDPADPEDKRIVAKLIADALAEAATEYETETEGLRTNNKRLLADLKKAQKGEGDPAEISRLESELEASKLALRESEKSLKKLTKDFEETNNKLGEESTYAQKLLVDNGLTEALVTSKVAPEYLDAVKALLAPQITIKTDSNGRSAVVGDKSLGDFVKEWSQGDQGKAFIAANINGGGDAKGGRANGGDGKSITRAAYDAAIAADPSSGAKMLEGGVTLTD